MNLDEKIKALNEIADRISERFPQARFGTGRRFAQWNDTASHVFLNAIDEAGYELVRKGEGGGEQVQ